MKYILIFKKITHCLLISTLALVLGACGGGGGGGASPSPSSSFTIGGTISGLTGTLILDNNGNDPLSLSVNGQFTFPSPVATNGNYAVTVNTQPAGKICTVINGSGFGVVTNVTNIQVICSLTGKIHTVSGTVSGLSSGEQVTLLNNSANKLTVTGSSSPTSFTFTTPIADNAGYSVTVDKQPVGKTCTVTNYASSAVLADVTNIKVICSNVTHLIRGSVSGLSSGQQVSLLMNDASGLSVVAGVDNSTPFTFFTPVADMASYNVTVATQSVGKTCTVNNHSGVGVVNDVTNIQVICSDLSFTISGFVTGLPTDKGVALLNNGTNQLFVSGANTVQDPFHFTLPIAYNTRYDVTVALQSLGSGFFCEAAYDTSMGIVSSDVKNVNVACVPDFTVSTLTNRSLDLVSLVSSPQQIAIDSESNMYVADYSYKKILKITPAGQITPIVGSKDSNAPVNGPLSIARFSHPKGIAIDGAGTLYVSDDHAIRRITSSDVSTLVGYSSEAGHQDATTPNDVPNARFNNPSGLAVNRAGTELYVADRDNNLIRKITINASGEATSVKTLPKQFENADHSYGDFNRPNSVTLDDSESRLYVADTNNNKIHFIYLTDPSIQYAQTIMSGVSSPQYMAIYNSNQTASYLYSTSRYGITQFQLYAVKDVDFRPPTVAGGAVGTAPVDGVGSTAYFMNLNGIVRDPRTGAFYLADDGAIRKFAPPTPLPH